MNITDLTLLLLLSLFGLRGYFKGLFRESFSLSGLLVGLVVSSRYGEALAVFWSEHWQFSPFLLKVASFVILFFAVYFAFSLAGWLLHHSAKFLFLQGFDRIGGILVGTGKGSVILAFMLLLLASIPFVPQPLKQKIDESYLAAPLNRFAREIYQIGKVRLLPPEEAQGSHKRVRSS